MEARLEEPKGFHIVYSLDMFKCADVDELESHNNGKSKISYGHVQDCRIKFIWMAQYPMISSAKIQLILHRYALLFLLWDTPLLFDLVKLKSCYPGRYFACVSMKHH